jgi:hypothetical protein
MRKFVRVGVLAVALAAAVVGGGTSGAAAASAAGCTGTIQINSYTFSPAAVPVGGTATATMVAQNCTNTAQSATGIWFATYHTAGGGGALNCSTIDPIPRPANFAPLGTLTQTFTVTVPAGCTATVLNATVDLDLPSNVVVTAVANLTITPPSNSCTVNYAKNEWTGGFVANLTITNKTTTAINGWTLAFTFPGDQVISSNTWNAVTVQKGASVTSTNEPYNKMINPGASTSFGFQGTWTRDDSTPTAFALNGVFCTIV